MKRLFLSIALLAGITGSALAMSSDSSCRFVFREVFLMGGSVNGRQEPADIGDFKQFAPNSALLNSNFSGMNRNFMRRSGSVELAHLGIGFTVGKKGPLYRAAIGLGTGARLEGRYSRDMRKTIDTLYSPSTGRTAYVDTLYGESYYFESASQILNLDASAIWRSRDHKRWSLFGGVGASVGITLNAWSEFTYSNYGYLRSGNYMLANREQVYNSSFYSNYEVTERYNNKMQSTFAVYAPLGIDFKMGTKRSFWKPIHFFYETRLRLQYYNIPELNSGFSGNAYHAFGIRYKFKYKR